jgi:hypothetical protein
MWGWDEIQEELAQQKMSSLRKERYRTKARIGMRDIRDILLCAAYHTQAVMARAHVEPGLDVKIGQFITSLKSELQQHPLRSSFSSLTTKYAWSDTLVLSSSGKGGLEKNIADAVNAAMTDFYYNQDRFEGVTRRLKAMEESPISLMSHVKAMKELNVQAEHIMNSLCSLAETIDE